MYGKAMQFSKKGMQNCFSLSQYEIGMYDSDCISQVSEGIDQTQEIKM
jgi:hypothetical protein